MRGWGIAGHRRVDPGHIDRIAELLPVLNGERFDLLDQRVITDRGGNYTIIALRQGIYFMSDMGRSIRVTINRHGELVVFFYRRSFNDGYSWYNLRCTNGRHARISTHRAVLYTFRGPPPEGMPHGDHNNRDRNYNVLWNLAWVSISANNANRGTRQDNTSGVTGVMYRSSRNIYVAYITVNGKKYSRIFHCDSRRQGDTDAYNRAVQARREMEQMYR